VTEKFFERLESLGKMWRHRSPSDNIQFQSSVAWLSLVRLKGHITNYKFRLSVLDVLQMLVSAQFCKAFTDYSILFACNKKVILLHKEYVLMMWK
jgi:hypothetical protein